jgi:hypothetical protein
MWAERALASKLKMLLKKGFILSPISNQSPSKPNSSKLFPNIKRRQNNGEHCNADGDSAKSYMQKANK